MAGSDRQGFVYYEWRRGYERIELDFAVWMEGFGRVALQVKGGDYVLIDGGWRLKTRDGIKAVRSCPLDEAWLAALDLHDDIEERGCTPYNPYVVPVLAFPDMTEPDPSIENLARRKGVYMIWGSGNLLADLEEIVLSRRVSEALGMESVAREVHAVTDGLICLEKFGNGGVGDAADQAGSAANRRQHTETLRLRLVGVDVTMNHARGVRPAG